MRSDIVEESDFITDAAYNSTYVNDVQNFIAKVLYNNFLTEDGNAWRDIEYNYTKKNTFSKKMRIQVFCLRSAVHQKHDFSAHMIMTIVLYFLVQQQALDMPSLLMML